MSFTPFFVSIHLVSFHHLLQMIYNIKTTMKKFSKLVEKKSIEELAKIAESTRAKVRAEQPRSISPTTLAEMMGIEVIDNRNIDEINKERGLSFVGVNILDDELCQFN